MREYEVYGIKKDIGKDEIRCILAEEELELYFK